jgi:hypothetical protein
MRRRAGTAIARDDQSDGGSGKAERRSCKNRIARPEHTDHDPSPPVISEVGQSIDNVS